MIRTGMFFAVIAARRMTNRDDDKAVIPIPNIKSFQVAHIVSFVVGADHQKLK